MGAELGGFPIDRFGDIFSGYFALACASHLGFAARFGTPVAHHRRNSHNYIRDAAQEIAGIGLLEELLPWLQEAKLHGADFAETYLSLSDLLEETVLHRTGFLWTDATRSSFRATAARMRAWVSVCRQLAEAVENSSNHKETLRNVPRRFSQSHRRHPRTPGKKRLDYAPPASRRSHRLFRQQQGPLFLHPANAPSPRCRRLLRHHLERCQQEEGVPNLVRNWKFQLARLVEYNYPITGGPDIAICFGLKRLLQLGYDYIGLQPGWLSRLMQLFELGGDQGLVCGAASVRCYVNRVLEYRNSYSIDWASGAGMLLFSRPAAQLVLDNYLRPVMTTHSIKQFYADTFGVDIRNNEWNI